METTAHLKSESAHALKTSHLFSCDMQQCLHDGQYGADVKVWGGSLRWEQQKPTWILITVKTKRQLKTTTIIWGGKNRIISLCCWRMLT